MLPPSSQQSWRPGLVSSAMATEIHQVGSETPSSSEKGHIDEKNAVTTSDVEGNFEDDSKRLVPDRAEATELTPVEAFKWNVEGDQSPCMPFLLSLFVESNL